MQLDPKSALAEQLKAYSGSDLESLVAAAVSHLGYFFLKSVRLEEDGESIAEADIFASQVSPLRESRLLFECKGGAPKANDIRKFSSFRSLIDPSPDALLLVVKHGFPARRVEVARKLGVRVIERPNFAYQILPLLGGAASRELRVRALNRHLAAQMIHDYLVSQIPKGPQQTKQHFRFVVTDLWQEPSPLQQVKKSYDAYTNQFPATWSKAASDKGIKENDALYYATDDDYEAATYTVLIHRFVNAYAITRWTIDLAAHESPGALVDQAGLSLREAISALSSRPRWISGFAPFVQQFCLLWGGFFVSARLQEEKQAMAEDLGAPVDAIDHYLSVLDKLYAGVGGKLFYDWNGHRIFKYIPGAFRALGFLTRENRFPGQYSDFNFFGKSETSFRAALDRALNLHGGIAALQL